MFAFLTMMTDLLFRGERPFSDMSPLIAAPAEEEEEEEEEEEGRCGSDPEG